jgi:tetratricopeptide (TPR) repeat protein
VKKTFLIAATILFCGVFSTCRDNRLITANALLESGDFLSAREIYSRIVAAHPKQFAARYGLGMSYSAEAIFRTDLGLAVPGDWYRAIYEITIATHLDTITEARRTLAILHYNLGTCFRKLGNQAEAIQRIARAISYDSTLVKAYNLLGTLYQEQGDLEKAENCYRRTLLLKPDYAMTHFNLGTLAWARNDFRQALADFANAAAIEPENALFQTWLDRTREHAGSR